MEPYPDEQLGLADGYASPEARYKQREAVELAFIAALQHLPARQRAVLILQEVLGFSAKEVAGVLDTTPASVNSALQRARKTVKAQLPRQSQQAAMRSLGDKRLRDLVQRLTDALEAGRVEVIVALLAVDATFAMPPYPGWYRGRDALSKSWLMPGGPPAGIRYVPTRANGQLALGAYKLDPQQDSYLPVALDVLSLQDQAAGDKPVAWAGTQEAVAGEAGAVAGAFSGSGWRSSRIPPIRRGYCGVPPRGSGRILPG